MSDLSGLYGLAGVIVGATITQGVAWLQKRKRHLSYWSAMSAEIDLCRGLADAYLNDQVSAPLYRLPTIAYEAGFPALLGDGAVAKDEATTMLRFYSQVAQLNRGLDQIHEATVRQAPLDPEVRRLRLKAEKLLDKCQQDPGGPYYRAAREVIDRHVPAK